MLGDAVDCFYGRNGMRVVIHKNGMLEMSIINVIFLTNVEKWPIFLI